MNAFTWFDDSFSWRLLQTLIHFLWQGCSIALIALVVDRLLQRASSAARYRAHASALLLMVACLPVTFAMIRTSTKERDVRDVMPGTNQSAFATTTTATSSVLRPVSSEWQVSRVKLDSDEVPAPVADSLAGAQMTKAATADLAATPENDTATKADSLDVASVVKSVKSRFVARWLIPYSPLIAAGYLIGVLFMTLRLLLALRGGQRLRQASEPVTDSQLLSMIERQVQRIGLRVAPAIAYCREISVPVVMGVANPLILIPASLASGLSPDQLQALLTHELAHLRRFDPLVNLLQRLIEAVLFFHPAVWYVSRRVTIERENASDDLVLAAGFPRITYADALVRMAELSVSLRHPCLAITTLAASGDRPSEFKRRVLRLLNGDAPNVRLTDRGIFSLLFVAAVGLSVPVFMPAWEASSPSENVEGASATGNAGHIGRKIDDFVLRDYLGAAHQLQDFSGSRLVVVAFLGAECPLAKAYATRLVRLADDYGARRVAFIGINSNRQDTPTEIGHYVRQYGIKFPLLKDPGNRVADQFGAERTPEVFVLDEQRVVRYWGSIDDQFGVGYARPNSTQQFLVEAIDDLLAGQQVRRPESLSVGCHIGRISRNAPTGDITYSNQISRILQRRCIECHRQGGIAPFTLDSYTEVAGWAETIREVVKDQRMPPWHADPKYGHFSNDSRMPDQEKQLLDQWVENGLPEGSSADLLPPAAFVDGWSLGTPDLVVSMTEPFAVSPDGLVPYQYITVDPGFTEGKWVRASEVRPGVRSVVHHVVVFINPPGGDPILKEKGVGFEMVGSYVPGSPPMQLEDGVARYVPPGSTFVFQMHYTPDGTAQKDRSEIGLYFAAPKTIRRTMQTGVAVNLDFVIPPHAEAHRVEADVRLSHDTEIHALIPHMHYRGKSFRFSAIYPNGSREILLDVPRFDFNWQNTYRLAKPKLLPEGTLLNCVSYFDNSKNNLSNPDPTVPVKWGEQTWEEMMVGYFECVYLNQDLSRPEPEITRLGNGGCRVHFEYRPDRPVRAVNLAGTFNEWNTFSHPLEDPDRDGVYTADVDLKAGPHRYKFVVDGNYWTHDPASRILTGFFHESFFVAGNELKRETASQP